MIADPRIHALLLCGAVDRSGPPGHLDLLGIFTAVHGRSFPIELRRFHAFVRMGPADGGDPARSTRGAKPGRTRGSTENAGLVILECRSGEVVASGRTSLVLDDADRTKDFVVQIGPLWIPRAGDYEVRLLLDGKPAATTRIEALGLDPRL